MKTPKNASSPEKYTPFVGPVALALAAGVWAWALAYPSNGGYGMPIFFLLLVSIVSGVAMLKNSPTPLQRAIAWACIVAPAIVILLFLYFIIGLSVGSFA